MGEGRRSARRQAVFILYQQDLLKLSSHEALGRSQDEVNDYACRIVKGVDDHKAQIDSLLDEHLSGWSLERLGPLERAILRVSAYELVAEEDVPVAVAIDQAVTLAKRFCSGEASALVNGVLGALASAARPAASSEMDESGTAG